MGDPFCGFDASEEGSEARRPEVIEENTVIAWNGKREGNIGSSQEHPWPKYKPYRVLIGLPQEHPPNISLLSTMCGQYTILPSSICPWSRQ